MGVLSGDVFPPVSLVIKLIWARTAKKELNSNKRLKSVDNRKRNQKKRRTNLMTKKRSSTKKYRSKQSLLKSANSSKRRSLRSKATRGLLWKLCTPSPNKPKSWRKSGKPRSKKCWRGTRRRSSHWSPRRSKSSAGRPRATNC